MLDDSDGRRVASRLGLNVTGLLGVLVIAKSRGMILAVKPTLDDLMTKANFQVSNQLYANVLQAAGE